MVRGLLAIALALAGAGCRGDQKAPAAPRTTSLAAGEMTDPGAGAGDVVVATVDGRPVWASCVEHHAKARGLTREAALDACVELELLAAAAVARGIGDDASIQRDLRAALVDGFVGDEFEDVFTTAAALPPGVVDQAVVHYAGQLDVPEERTVVYARAKFFADAKAPPPAEGSPEDLAAKAFAGEIYAQVAGKDDLFPDDIYAAARAVAGTRNFHLGDKPFTMPRHGVAVESFAAAGFAIPAIGQVSPPTRTRWGWDVILLVDIAPPVHRTRDELVAEQFPNLRRLYFDQVWTRELAKPHAIEAHPELLAEPADEEAPPEGDGPGPGGEEPAP
jgi:hypothetical protein